MLLLPLALLDYSWGWHQCFEVKAHRSVFQGTKILPGKKKKKEKEKITERARNKIALDLKYPRFYRGSSLNWIWGWTRTKIRTQIQIDYAAAQEGGFQPLGVVALLEKTPRLPNYPKGTGGLRPALCTSTFTCTRSRQGPPGLLKEPDPQRACNLLLLQLADQLAPAEILIHIIAFGQ